jgi:transposase
MRTALPVIREDAAALKQRLQHEHEGRTRPRLQLLYRLASGQAHTRRKVARLLGVHRHTIGHWLARYATGSVEGRLVDLRQPQRPAKGQTGRRRKGRTKSRTNRG